MADPVVPAAASVPAAEPAAAPAAHVRTVPMYNPQDGETREVPIDKVARGQQAGLKPAWTASEAALAGLGHGLTLGYADELSGALHAAPEALKDAYHAVTGQSHGDTFGHTKDAYLAARDERRGQERDAEEQHPYTYGAGKLAGNVATGLALPGGVGALAAQGAVQGVGESNSYDPTEIAKDAATGAAGGAIGGAVGKGIEALGGAAVKALRPAAEGAVTRAAGITAKDLGGHEAAAVGRTALAEPGLIPGALERANSGAAQLAERADAARRTAGKALASEHYIPFDVAHGPSVNLKNTAEAIENASKEAVRVKPELSRHVSRAVRELHPEAFDDAIARAARGKANALADLSAARKAGLSHADISARAGRLARAEARVSELEANPSTAFDPNHHITLQDTQGAINRLRQLGARPEGGHVVESLEEANARNSVTTPAWHETAGALRNTVAQHDPAALPALNAARAKYGDLSALAEGANAAAQRQAGQSHLGLYQPAIIAGATGHPLAAASLAAGPAAYHVGAPRAAAALNSVANAAEGAAKVHAGIGRPTHKLVGTFGKYFANATPERRVQIDHRLQEHSPAYRKMRAEAEAEHSAAQKRLDQDTSD